MNAVLEFRNFSKIYQGRAVVDDLTFSVDEGRIVGLLGRNGAGKSTSLRGLLGLISPSSGSAEVFGRRFADLGPESRNVGVSIEGIASTPDATVRRDLAVWTGLLGLPKRRISEVIELVGLEDAAGRVVKKLSTGMRQRHALAVAMLADPRVLILDEPTNGLDPDGIRWLRTFLRNRAADGTTVLLSSHMLAEVEQTVDDVVILQQSLRFAGTLSELTGNGERRLEECFFDLVPPAGNTTTEVRTHA